MQLRTIVLSLWCAAACASPSEPGLIPLAAVEETVVLVVDVDNPAWPTDAIDLESASITGNTLRLDTRYGGGCRDHDAALLVERAFMETAPPRLRTRIAHESNNDACKALVFRTLNIDLTPVRLHYQDAYGPGPGSVVLVIAGQSVLYTF